MSDEGISLGLRISIALTSRGEKTPPLPLDTRGRGGVTRFPETDAARSNSSSPDRRAAADQAKLNPLLFSGSVLTRLPVAAKMALATAGRIGGRTGSPSPVGAKSVFL